MNSIRRKTPVAHLTAMCMTFATAFAAIATIVPVAAQTPQSTGQRTTLYVNVIVRQQEITAGPYARYAQKYLGVAAPLADKVLHEVISAKILETGNMADDSEVVGSDTPSHMRPESGFPKLTVDKMSAATLGLEESARLAAEKIFEIRKSRFDLITGDVGENVFGGGLSSALAELNRLEEEYLSLFLGRQTIKTNIGRYRVLPVRGKLTYTVCRFSDTDGLLPEDDLSGVPVVLELKPAGTSAENAGVQAKPNPRAIAQLIPADVQCRIILGGRELASELVAILQLGETVYVIP